MLAGAVVLVAGLTLAALPHHPSTSQRATDLRGAVQTMNTDIESCAGGVSESLTALRAIQTGTSHDVKTAVSIATLGAQNCSPANSMPMDDLVQYQPPGEPGWNTTPMPTSVVPLERKFPLSALEAFLIES